MTSNIFCWPNTNTYVITSTISLITILFGARADVINQTKFTVSMDTDITNLTLPISPVTTCLAAYMVCEDGYLCSKNWHISNKCHSEYTNVEIIKKCENFVETGSINDTALFAPMTNVEKDITYLNVYCGICNFEEELSKFELWTPWLFFKNNTNTFSSKKKIFISSEFIRPVDSTEMLDKLEVDGYNNLDLIDVSNDTIPKRYVLRVVPDHLKYYVNQCITPTEKSRKKGPSERVIAQTFSRNLNQNYSDPNGLKFCLLENSSMESYCDYRDEYGDLCTLNVFVMNYYSYCLSEGYTPWDLSKNEFVIAQCSQHTSLKNYFYVCGPSKSNLYEKIKNKVFNILDHVSAFSLFLYLALSTSKQNLRSLPKRIFYSYSVTLFAFYVLQFPLKYVKSCVIKYYIFSYTWQSHSFWILILSFDLWRLVYNSSKFQKVSVERQTKRYLFYCALGWGLPALFLAALFPTVTQDQKSWSCPSVVGFENELVCSSTCDLNKYTFNFSWVTIAIFLLLIPALLILTCVLVFLSMRNRARSKVNRHYTTVLLKVSIMMGLHWTLLVYLTLFDSGKKFIFIHKFLASFHGCFIFFAFGLKENWNKFKKVVSTSATEEIQLTSSQSNKNTRSLPERSLELKKLNGNVDETRKYTLKKP